MGLKMTVSAEATPDGGELTIKVDGRFDFSSLQEFRTAYEKVEVKPQKYLIDLANSDYLDSSALGMLLALRDYAGGESSDISIINCNPDVRKILVITKLDELFKVE